MWENRRGPLASVFTCECDGGGGEDGQQALSLQVEEMLLLHLKKLLLDGDLLGCQLGHRDDTIKA